eukprot:CAMPEP_0171294404 /NCGR_PEP_ID=MMETSP0816-20121228/2882_1 /TAXON_ID=420281 /ORGANISM="Proboscia inermis, Strain CCAP1064/1" /LENGTH=50 /DNA_ID=CAMNT_0011766199 /DNA_START=663 /DNA_END=815 /DNA_ORIENTATION=+
MNLHRNSTQNEFWDLLFVMPVHAEDLVLRRGETTSKEGVHLLELCRALYH